MFLRRQVVKVNPRSMRSWHHHILKFVFSYIQILSDYSKQIIKSMFSMRDREEAFIYSLLSVTRSLIRLSVEQTKNGFKKKITQVSIKTFLVCLKILFCIGVILIILYAFIFCLIILHKFWISMIIKNSTQIPLDDVYNKLDFVGP